VNGSQSGASGSANGAQPPGPGSHTREEQAMKTTEKRIDRLLENLTALQKASLILRHLSADDIEAVYQVSDSIPLRQYGPMPDRETISAFDGMKVAISFWAAEHWRYMLVFVVGFASAADSDSLDDEDADERQLEPFEIALSRLVSLDGALGTFCQKTGLDAVVVTRLTGAAPFWTMTNELVGSLAKRTGIPASELKKTVDTRPVALLVSSAVADEEYERRVTATMCDGL
jgi:hypothetical protein